MSTRASFLFPKDASAALDAIKSKTDIKDDADIIRLALSAFDCLLELDELSCKIFVRDRERREWPYSPHLRFVYPGLTDVAEEKLDDSLEKRSNGVHAKNFFFSGPAVQRLKAIRARSEMSTNGDAIRVALTKFNQLLQVETTGDSVVVRDLKGHESLFNLFNPQARRQLCTSAKSMAAEPAI